MSILVFFEGQYLIPRAADCMFAASIGDSPVHPESKSKFVRTIRLLMLAGF